MSRVWNTTAMVSNDRQDRGAEAWIALPRDRDSRMAHVNLPNPGASLTIPGNLTCVEDSCHGGSGGTSAARTGMAAEIRPPGTYRFSTHSRSAPSAPLRSAGYVPTCRDANQRHAKSRGLHSPVVWLVRLNLRPSRIHGGARRGSLVHDWIPQSGKGS